jgi:hypothetical protein
MQASLSFRDRDEVLERRNLRKRLASWRRLPGAAVSVTATDTRAVVASA